MNVVVVLLLIMGGFLIMDAVGEKRVTRAERESRKTVKYVPLSIYDEQLSGRSMRDDFSNMFYSSGPWMFRDDFAGIPAAGDRDEIDDATELAFTELQKSRADLVSSPNAIAAERRRVEERIRAQFDKLAEERLRKRAGLAANDPMLESFSSVPKNAAERLRQRRERREARRAAAAEAPKKR